SRPARRPCRDRRRRPHPRDPARADARHPPRAWRRQGSRSGQGRSWLLRLLPGRTSVLDRGLVVADLVRPVLAIERPVLVSRRRLLRPEESLGGEDLLRVHVALEEPLLALRRLEGDDVLLAFE